MRRNPCGIRELHRSDTGGYADVFCRIERGKRKRAIENDAWDRLQTLHRNYLKISHAAFAMFYTGKQ